MGKKEDIFSAGYELFSKNGFKAVTISDITHLAGISVGSFYNYYQSKESLFVEMFSEENKKVKNHIIESLDVSASPADIAQQYTLLSMEAMNKSLILCEWYGENIGEELRNQYQSDPKNSATSIRGFLENLLEKWRLDNSLRADISNNEILSIFDALVYLDVNSNSVISANFTKTIQWLVKFAALGITNNYKE